MALGAHLEVCHSRRRGSQGSQGLDRESWYRNMRGSVRAHGGRRFVHERVTLGRGGRFDLLEKRRGEEGLHMRLGCEGKGADLANLVAMVGKRLGNSGLSHLLD